MKKAGGAVGLGSFEEEREGLTLSRYGEVMAHMQHFPRAKGAEVLARLGLTPRRWEAAILSWTDALAKESAAEGDELSKRFGTAFAETRARLKKEQPTLASIGPLPDTRAADNVQETRGSSSIDITEEVCVADVKGPALPFQALSIAAFGAGSPSLSLEQHASLCVELEMTPMAQVERTLQRYHLTREQHSQVDAYWRGRIAESPRLYAAWHSARAVYSDWLRTQR